MQVILSFSVLRSTQGGSKCFLSRGRLGGRRRRSIFPSISYCLLSFDVNLEIVRAPFPDSALLHASVRQTDINLYFSASHSLQFSSS